MDFTVLLDAPAKPLSRIQIAKLGSFSDSRYGDFQITEQNVRNWQKNLEKLPGGEALIDFEHRSERKPRDSSAAGWITSIDLDGDRVMADARWTPKGEQAIRNEEYRFLSPVFGPTQVENQLLEDALPSAALTNKPFLGSMPAVMLASAERVSEALEEDPASRFYLRALDGKLGDLAEALVLLDVSQAERDRAKDAGNSLPDGSYPINNTKQLRSAAVLAASHHGNWQAAQRLIRRRAKELGVDVSTLPGFGESKSLDSPAPMQIELLKALGLDEDQELAKALEAVEISEDASKKLLDAANGLAAKLTELTPAERTPEEQRRQLDADLADQGLVALDANELTALRRDASAGAEAMKQLHAERFENAFREAVKARKAAPSEQADLKHFYELDADATLKMLDAREPILPEKPIGAPAIELDDEASPEQVAAAGLHPQSHGLDQAIRKYMLENKLPDTDYVKVFEQVQTGAVRL